VATPPRRTTVSLAAASLVGLAALAVGFGGGWLTRNVTAPTTSTTSTTTTSSTTTTTTTVVPLAACIGTELVGTVSTSPGGAAGTVEATFDVSDVGTSGCTLDGYPQLQLLDANMVPITSTTEDGGASFAVAQANRPARVVRLRSGVEASFMIQFSEIPVGTETTCPQASSFNVYPPTSTTSFNIQYQLGPCNAGTVHVSPFFLAT
jgi:hypothetical protein